MKIKKLKYKRISFIAMDPMDPMGERVVNGSPHDSGYEEAPVYQTLEAYIASQRLGLAWVNNPYRGGVKLSFGKSHFVECPATYMSNLFEKTSVQSFDAWRDSVGEFDSEKSDWQLLIDRKGYDVLELHENGYKLKQSRKSEVRPIFLERQEGALLLDSKRVKSLKVQSAAEKEIHPDLLTGFTLDSVVSISAYNTESEVSPLCKLLIYKDQKSRQIAYVTDIRRQVDIQLYDDADCDVQRDGKPGVMSGMKVMAFVIAFCKQSDISSLILQDATEIQVLNPGKEIKATKMALFHFFAQKGKTYYQKNGFQRCEIQGVDEAVLRGLYDRWFVKSVTQLREQLIRGGKENLDEVFKHYKQQTKGATKGATTIKDLFEYYDKHRVDFKEAQFNLAQAVSPENLQLRSALNMVYVNAYYEAGI